MKDWMSRELGQGPARDGPQTPGARLARQ